MLNREDLMENLYIEIRDHNKELDWINELKYGNVEVGYIELNQDKDISN